MTATDPNLLLAAPDELRLGEPGEVVLDSVELNRAAALLLARQAKYSLLIMSHNLDPEVFSTRDFGEALSRLARRARQKAVKILIRDNRRLIHETHRLLDVIRQFGTFIELRKTPRKFAGSDQEFVLADADGVLARQPGGAYAATLHLHNPGLAKGLREEFMGMWEHSEPDPYVRQLSFGN
jgi:hypothetical protein